MGRSTVSTSPDYCTLGAATELPEHPATVSDFALDKYEVTVGRFRQFVAAYDSWHTAQGMPRAGDGVNPSNFATGWLESWSSILPAVSSTLIANLKGADTPTWTDLPGPYENHPINFITWYEAFAFCIWDGGRLPTEAEWEYTAAGGALDRLFPWAPLPGDSCIAGCDSCVSQYQLAPVGQAILGAGYWGHLDLAANVWEFVYDHFAPYTTGACVNCAATTGSYRVARGGSVIAGRLSFRVAARRNYYYSAEDRRFELGFRCAR